MPYAWRDTGPGDLDELHLWPHRSLPRRGFVWFIGVTAALLALPLLAVLGTVVLWGLLPFLVAVVGGLWWALARSYRDGTLTEILRIGPDRITLTRHAPDGTEQHWQANRYWVAVTLYPTGGPVPQYLTLKGDGREVELGAFLAEGERVTLARELQDRMAAQR